LCANSCWIQIVVHQAINDARQLRLNQEITGGLKSRYELTKSSAELLHKVNNFLLGFVIREPIVQISDDVNTELAGELVSWPGSATKGEGNGTGKDQ